MKNATSSFRSHALMTAIALSGWGLFLLGAGSPIPGGKVAVINSEKVTTSSTQVQKLLADASVSANAIGDEIKKKQEALQKASDRFSSQQSVTADEENKKRRDELKKMGEELEELNFRLNREVKNAQEKAVNPLRDKIVKAIGDIAKTEGITVVISTENTVYYDPQVDLTQAVVAKIDGKK